MNITEKLLSVNVEEMSKREVEELEIPRLSKMLGEKFLVKVGAISGGRYVEFMSNASDGRGKMDSSKLYEAQKQIATAGMIEPNLKDEALQKHFGVRTPKDLLDRLFNGGEITKIFTRVSELSGYGEDSEEDLKN